MTVFFDLDGTLTDSAPGITRCLAHAFEHIGAPVPPNAELPSDVAAALDAAVTRSARVEC